MEEKKERVSQEDHDDVDTLEKEVEELEEEIVEEEPELTNEEYLALVLQKAKDAARPLSGMIAMKKNAALMAMADGLEEAEEALLEANEEDLKAFEEDESRAAMADRLRRLARPGLDGHQHTRVEAIGGGGLGDRAVTRHVSQLVPDLAGSR